MPWSLGVANHNLTVIGYLAPGFVHFGPRPDKPVALRCDVVFL